MRERRTDDVHIHAGTLIDLGSSGALAASRLTRTVQSGQVTADAGNHPLLARHPDAAASN